MPHPNPTLDNMVILKRSMPMKHFFPTLALCAASLFAQGTDYSKVEIKVNKIGDNFATLDGSGGTIGVLYGPDGVFMVDTQFAPLSDKIAAAIKTLTPQPIRWIVNTHLHGDHTGGNVNFGKMGAMLLSRAQLRDRLSKAAGNTPATPVEGLAKLTYDNDVTLHINGAPVQLIAIRKAHTDGDTLVRFPSLDILMTGDYYRSIGYPNIDRANGGSLEGMIDGLAKTIDLAGPNTKIVPGHGATVTKAEVAAHRDVLIQLAARVRAAVAKGMTEDQVVAAKLTNEFDAKIKEPGTTGERAVRQIYNEVK
jgi:glyoxylase-like metal-dependent hydrolase (beta-lactamase superfamily II)